MYLSSCASEVTWHYIYFRMVDTLPCSVQKGLQAWQCHPLHWCQRKCWRGSAVDWSCCWWRFWPSRPSTTCPMSRIWSMHSLLLWPSSLGGKCYMAQCLYTEQDNSHWLHRCISQCCLAMLWLLDPWTSDNLDAGHAKVDHIPLYSRFALASSLPSPTQKGPLFDRKALKDATAETWERFFQDWPCIDWSMDVTTHAHILEQHLHRQLQAFFPHRPQHRRGSVFTAETWELHSQRNHLRKQLRAHRHELELWLQWMGLQRLRRLTCTWIPLLNFSIRCAARWKLFRQ